MNVPHLANLILSSALCASCAQLERQPASAAAPAAQPAGVWGGSKLYARDGSVVAGAGGGAEGVENEAGPAPRDLAPSDGGRMYILELYQKAIDERDALELEARALQADVDGARAALANSDRELAALQAQVERLAAENQRLLDENVELAARLTTAQIRRLQVEKILLEVRVAELKAAQAAQAAQAVQAAAPATAQAEMKDD